MTGLRTATSVAVLLACAAAAMAPEPAQARGRWSVGIHVGVPVYPHGYYSGGWGRGYGPYGYGGYGGYWGGPGVLLVSPPPVVAQEAPAVVTAPPAPSRPDPVIYPRNGQDAQQTEFDRQECNRWATTQPAALADASVFQRAVEACMDGRGYSMR